MSTEALQQFEVPEEEVGFFWVPKTLVPHFVARVRSHLENALAQSAGEMSFPSLVDRLNRGEYRLLVGCCSDDMVAAYVVGVVHYAEFAAMRVILGGDQDFRKHLSRLVSTLEQECVTLGYKQVELFGRPGFARALRDYSDHQYTVMVRKVPDVGR